MTANPRTAIGNRIAPVRFLLFAASLILATAGALGCTDGPHAILAGFSTAASVFLLSCLPLLGHDPQGIRDSAARNDANRVTMLVLTVVLALVVLVTIASVLAERGTPTRAAIALIIVTLVLAWTFANTVFALHYAHLYYQRDGAGDLGGLGFPDTEEPDYPDFLYFSITLGMTFQTSDVTISGRHMRRVALLQSIAAFIFNIGILAFTINALGGS
jgi:uncharacterized membrane protein